MKKLVVSACIAVLALLSLVALRREELWVVPNVEVAITGDDGRVVEIESDEISVKSDEIGDVTYETEAVGRIVIRPVKAWKRISLGNPVFTTLITVDPKGFKQCQACVDLTGGEVGGFLSPQRYRVRFRLAKEGADGDSKSDLYGFRSDGSEYLMK